MANKKRQGWQFTSQFRQTTPVIEIADSSRADFTIDFIGHSISARDPNPTHAKLLQQFLHLNRNIFRHLGLDASAFYNGDTVFLRIQSSIQIGALPLLSPISGRPDLSLVVKPRFGWKGIGPLIASTGWRILPSILSLPQLKVSERKIPPWVLSSVVLSKIASLLNVMERRFEVVERDLTAPKGAVSWSSYAVGRVPFGKFLTLPCKFPDLCDDRHLKAAIHFTLLKQRESLSTQREQGFFVIQMIDWCESLSRKVQDVLPQRPSTQLLNAMLSSRLGGHARMEGIRAIEWTVQEKGLGGLGDLNGLPWRMGMDELFEAFIEGIASRFARQVGASIKTGRLRETITSIDWEPRFVGSQRYLLPDLILEFGDSVVILDAKYKDHWEDLNVFGWQDIEAVIRERHRNDLLQVLAYAAVVDISEITCCLLYPCRRPTFDSLNQRNRLIHVASVVRGRRRIVIKLAALPLDISIKEGNVVMRKLVMSDEEHLLDDLNLD